MNFRSSHWKAFCKIGIMKSMIKLFEKFLWRSFFSRVTGYNPKVLLKMKCFPNIFQRFETTDLISYFIKQLFSKTPILRGSAQPVFTCSNSIELKSTMYKVNNKDTRETSFNVFLVSLLLNLNRFYNFF